MSKKTLIAAAAGTAFAAGLAAAPIASAAENPFALSGLSSGYQVADSHGAKKQTKTQTKTQTQTETKSQEGKCGGKTEAEMKAKEGKCGNTAKMKDGKCGEGKCGADTQGGTKSQGDARKAEPGKTSSEREMGGGAKK